MGTFFEGALDVEEMLEELEEAFPLRVQIGALASGISKTGGQIQGAFGIAPGLDAIPATRSDAKAGEVVAVGNKTATHVWTLLGAWPEIKAGQVLLEGGDRYEILLADVHTFGIHTDLKTMKVTQ